MCELNKIGKKANARGSYFKFALLTLINRCELHKEAVLRNYSPRKVYCLLVSSPRKVYCLLVSSPRKVYFCIVSIYKSLI